MIDFASDYQRSAPHLERAIGLNNHYISDIQPYALLLCNNGHRVRNMAYLAFRN